MAASAVAECRPARPGSAVFSEDPLFLRTGDGAARTDSYPDRSLEANRRGVGRLHENHGHVIALQTTLLY